MIPKMYHIYPKDLISTKWNGGITREIAIWPKNAIYKNRDFLWRVSSATVEQEESDFTALPDYERYISTIKGNMILDHGSKEKIELRPGYIYSFDGGISTHSKGMCTDFNLMLRKGECKGNMCSLHLPKVENLVLPILKKENASKESIIIYCIYGDAMLTDTGSKENIASGEAVLLDDADRPYLSCYQRSSFMLAYIIV